MSFIETMEALDNVRHSTPMSSEFFVESVAYQAAAIEFGAQSVRRHTDASDQG